MITFAILILTSGFSIFAMNRPDIKYKYFFHPYSIAHFNQHYRFLSHAFLHGDFLHLIFNMYALWIFGPVVEDQILPVLCGSFTEPNHKLGMALFIVLYTGAIYASSISEYYKNRNNSHYSSLGASGAVNALIFCYIVCAPMSTLGFFFIPMPAWVFGIAYLAISYYLSRRNTGNDSVDRIGHEAHFWGAIFGIVFIVILGFTNKEVFFELLRHH